MFRLCILIVVWTARSLFKSRRSLQFENIALRQQLAVFKHRQPRPTLRPEDRAFWVALRRLWPECMNALIIVTADTVVRWHREGFRRYWKRKCKRNCVGRPRVDRELRDLIRRMAAENSWGAPRIHAELLKLGFRISEKSVSRYLPKRPAPKDALKQWLAFLKNHRDAIAGIDFFTVPNVTFRLLHVFFLIRHDRRQIMHCAVSDHPTAAWVVQQIREASPFDTAPDYLIMDRDGKYGKVVPTTLKSWGIEPVQTAHKSPWQNGVAERWVQSVRKELLDHVVVLNEAHLERLLSDYMRYYNEDRCHLTLNKDPPQPRPVMLRPSPSAKIVGLPRVGGLHHRYEWRETG